MGITFLSKTSQEVLIRWLYAEAGLTTSETSYFETHSTGTQAGDPFEPGAIVSPFFYKKAACLITLSLSVLSRLTSVTQGALAGLQH